MNAWKVSPRIGLNGLSKLIPRVPTEMARRVAYFTRSSAS